ncbi:MAG: hypothetical protein J5808_02380 [Paludibacteraceae bacterium]|nr:hypothetical protein [Paludibacteraceae bacterium]
MKKLFNRLILALLAVLGFGACKSQTPASPAGQQHQAQESEKRDDNKSEMPDSQSGDERVIVKPDPGRMICLYGPPPARYRQMESEEQPESEK